MFWLNRVSSKYSKNTMHSATGKSFDEWVAVLNAANQRKQTSSSVRQYLMDVHQLTPAWARTIASYYHMR